MNLKASKGWIVGGFGGREGTGEVNIIILKSQKLKKIKKQEGKDMIKIYFM